MRKIWIQLFIVIIGIMLCIIGHNGAKRFIYKNYIYKETQSSLVYNDYFSASSKPNVIETEEVEIEESSLETTTTIVPTTKIYTTTSTTSITTEKAVLDIKKEEIVSNVVDNGEIILDGMTLTELSEKLNKSLNSTLTNTGHYFASYYKETGLDPYLAVAIVLHETGCKWTCSKLVKECNNIGGMKGSPSCNGGSYKKYNTLEEGINGYLDMLYDNYYSKGLNTPELINPKYAASTTWSEKINNYILEIKEK